MNNPLEPVIYNFSSHFPPGNLACTTGKQVGYLDSRPRVLAAADSLSIARGSLAVPEQTHSNHVRCITTSGTFPDTDGLVTDDDFIILTLQTADCIPVFIYDVQNSIRGLIHAGWRGIRSGIVQEGVSQFRNSGSKPGELTVLLGPSICQEHYPVSKDVADQFESAFVTIREEQYYLDLQLAVVIQLISLGVNKDKISNSKICSVEDPDCCSFRRDGEEAGRMVSFFGCTP